MEAASGGSAVGRVRPSPCRRTSAGSRTAAGGGAGLRGRAGRPGPSGWGRPWRRVPARRCRCVRRRPGAAAPGRPAPPPGRARTPAAGRRGSRRSRDGRRGAARTPRRVLLGPHRPGDPGTVQHPAFVGLGHQVLGLVVVTVGGLDGPQVDGDTVLLGRHHAGQQVAVAGDQDDVGTGAVAGQLGQLGVHGGVDALLRPAAVAAGEGAQPDGDPGHDPQPAVLGLRHPVGGAVEPVDAQQGPARVGLGPVAQPLDEGGVIDGDPGPRGLPGEETGGGPQQIPGVHQDDAAVHAIHPLSGRFASGLLRVCPTTPGLTARTRSSAWRFHTSFADPPCHTR
ncbi:hypothetical protein SHIRM173S_12166 [Streptomyces hirsutus]